MGESDHSDYCLQEYKYVFKPDILQGKVAFITGGASGIGFRIAEIFMRHGCSTVIASRRKEKLHEVVAIIIIMLGLHYYIFCSLPRS